VQLEPNGLVEAFIIGESFIGKEKVALILGDNIFYGSGFGNLLKSKTNVEGAAIFAYPVNNPERYGVVEFDKHQKVISIEEKPEHPKSLFVVPGLYFYDNSVVKLAKTVKPSARGEKEITTLNQIYLNNEQLEVGLMARGMAWLDTGTVDAMSDATEFVKIMEKRTGKKMACIEEIAFLNGYITKDQAILAAKKYGNSSYAQYIEKVVSE
jgi:glucose-1-phosphate thymidylyltransferase